MFTIIAPPQAACQAMRAEPPCKAEAVARPPGEARYLFGTAIVDERTISSGEPVSSRRASL